MTQGRSVKRREFLASVAALPLLGAGDGRQTDSQEAAEADHGKSNLPFKLGLIGFGSRGEELFHEVQQTDQKPVVRAVCDIFDQRLDRAIERSGGIAKGYPNYLDLLNDKDIDAVMIATPDHWHARMAIEAARRGKHIYLEVPVTRSLEEARALREAVKTGGVVFQLGHQGRQRDLNQKARELLANDTLGKITLIEATTNRNEPEGAWKTPAGERAEKDRIDWKQFQEPAGLDHPFSQDRYYGWRNYWDYGNGMSGELLCNEFDAVNSILDLGIPSSAIATGGCYFHGADREVPDVFQAAFEYPERAMTLLYSGTLANGTPRGILFMGRDASLELGRILSVWADKQSLKYRSRIEAGIIDPSAPFVHYMQDQEQLDGISSATSKYYADRGLDLTYRESKKVSPTRLHLAEWLACIAGKGKCSCNMDRGFELAAASHMATQSYLEGRKINWDPDNEVIL